jgi:hypothetical protein
MQETLERELSTSGFTKPELKAIRAAIAEALDGVGKAHGVRLDLGNITFDANTFHAKLSATRAGFDPAADAMKKHAELFGAKAEWLGKSFTTRQGTFTVAGINMKATSKPVVLKDAAGKTYSAPALMVARELGAARV